MGSIFCISVFDQYHDRKATDADMCIYLEIHAHMCQIMYRVLLLLGNVVILLKNTASCCYSATMSTNKLHQSFRFNFMVKFTERQL